MISDVNFHPSAEMLENYVAGTLPAGMSVAISAHVERCDSCRQQSGELESQATLNWLQQAPEDKAGARDFSALIDSIVASEQQTEEPESVPPVQEMHMQDRSVSLPRVLAKLASNGLVWNKMAGGIRQASVRLDDKTQCEFMYMNPGSQVPAHKHLGNEITLVLDGSFSDDGGTYRASDFVLRSGNSRHQPMSEEGCLCFAVLDQPFVFTRGLARIMNPYIRYRFRRATA